MARPVIPTSVLAYPNGLVYALFAEKLLWIHTRKGVVGDRMGGPAFGLLDGAYKAGAPFFA